MRREVTASLNRLATMANRRPFATRFPSTTSGITRSPAAPRTRPRAPAARGAVHERWEAKYRERFSRVSRKPLLSASPVALSPRPENVPPAAAALSQSAQEAGPVRRHQGLEERVDDQTADGEEVEDPRRGWGRTAAEASEERLGEKDAQRHERDDPDDRPGVPSEDRGHERMVRREQSHLRDVVRHVVHEDRAEEDRDRRRGQEREGDECGRV